MPRTINSETERNNDKRNKTFLSNDELVAQATLFCLRHVEKERSPQGGWSWKLFLAWRQPDGRLISQHTWLSAVSAAGVKDEFRNAILNSIDYPAHSTHLRKSGRYLLLEGPSGEPCPCRNMTQQDLDAEAEDETAAEVVEETPF